MIRHLPLSLMLLSSALGACAPVYSRPESPASAPQAEAAAPPVHREQEQKELILRTANALDEACKQLSEIGVACSFGTLRDRALMLLHYETIAAREAHGNDNVRVLGAPFCALASRDKMPFVRVELHGRDYQDLDCTQMTWGPLVALPILPPDQYCSGLRNDKRANQTCTTKSTNGMQSMIVVMPDRAQLSANEWLVGERMRTPFCAVNTARSWPALFGVRLINDNRGRNYNCELGQWGEWFLLRPETPATSRPAGSSQNQNMGST